MNTNDQEDLIVQVRDQLWNDIENQVEHRVWSQVWYQTRHLIARHVIVIQNQLKNNYE